MMEIVKNNFSSIAGFLPRIQCLLSRVFILFCGSAKKLEDSGSKLFSLFVECLSNRLMSWSNVI